MTASIAREVLNNDDVSNRCLHCQKHCGEANFCCHGCEAVHQFIKASGLQTYYHLRSKFSQASWQPVDETQRQHWVQQPQISEAGLTEFLWQRKGSLLSFAFLVPNLSCAACLWLIKAAFKGASAVEEVSFNFDQKFVIITISAPENSRLSDHASSFSQIVSILTRIGYCPYPPRLDGQDDAQRWQWRRDLVDLAISGAVFGNVMLFATAVYLGRDPGQLSYIEHQGVWQIAPEFRVMFDGIAAVLTGFSLVVVGRRFFKNAWNALIAQSLHIDQPIAFALALAYGVSVANLARGSSLLYFDSVAGLIFLLLMGRVAAGRLSWRAQRLANAAVSLLPPSDVKAGDSFSVAAGQVVVADGIVISGEGEVSEASLTGEHRPIVKRPGDYVLAGSQNFTNHLTIKAKLAASESYVHQVRQLIAAASACKPQLVTISEQVLRWFLWAIYLAAILAIVFWYNTGFSKTIEVLCAVLIVACPCALALATPLTLSFALKRAWQHGVIVKRQDVIDRLRRIDTVVLDKTATLTTGKAEVFHFDDSISTGFSQAEKCLVASLAAKSFHPVSVAVAAHLKDHLDGLACRWEHVREIPGQGICGVAILASGDKVHLAMGRGDFVLKQTSFLAEKAQAAVASIATDLPKARDLLSKDKHGICLVRETPQGITHQSMVKLASFSVVDPLCADAKLFVDDLKKRGQTLYLLSGDRSADVASAAATLGILDWQSGLSATEKAAFVKRLTEEGKRVMMIGDGINDAHALASADVGVAVKGGVDLALASADVFCARKGLGVVSELFDFARHTRHTLYGVIGFSLSYNLVAVSLALAGFLHPLAAALIMPLSSLTVVSAVLLRKGSRVWTSSTY